MIPELPLRILMLPHYLQGTYTSPGENDEMPSAPLPKYIAEYLFSYAGLPLSVYLKLITWLLL